MNDFHKWDAWSPWAKLDPDAKITFEGPDLGTVMAWAGNDKVGEGKMTLTESQPNDLLKLKVDFVKPFLGTATQEFAFSKVTRLRSPGACKAITTSSRRHSDW